MEYKHGRMLKFSLVVVVENNSRRKLSTHREYIKVAYVSVDEFCKRNNGYTKHRSPLNNRYSVVWNSYGDSEEVGLNCWHWCISTAIKTRPDMYVWYKLRSNHPHSNINILRSRQNGRRFADDVFKCIFLNKNVRISLKISLRFVTKVPIDSIGSDNGLAPFMRQAIIWTNEV